MDEYRIESGDTPDELEEYVIKSIELGYVPIGGVTVLYVDDNGKLTHNRSVLYQAMYKSDGWL